MSIHLAKNIRYLRKRLGMNQVELGRRIGTTNSTISFYENGNNEPTAGMLSKLAAALEVSVDDLLNKDLTMPQVVEPTEESRLIQYARELEEGRKSAEEALQELSEDDIALMNKLLKRRVRELEQAIKKDNPDLAKELDID
ncbi:MAG TPA: helix-turn-helix transcriptional regulator [Saprospiraceae bacterium]|nr:helix-turn-helix transcriptional regulator [Saprospiraceae bacterium]